jgi:trk system potassium uptake protein TrkH
MRPFPPPKTSVINLPQRRPQLSPTQFIALSYIVGIAVGTGLLWLPIAHTPGSDVGFLAALFTATSALCVTGLTVIDVGTALSVFGQVVMMVLMQAGGLGIVTLGTLGAIIIGRRVGFRERMRLMTQVNAFQVGGLVRLIRNIALMVFGLELVGGLLLYIRFSALKGPGEGAFYAAFHSVSAFNNAGFALYSNNLIPFVGDPLVSLTIAALIVLGGLGFIVIANVTLHLRNRRRFRLSLHSKVALLTTALLIVVGTLVILGLEWTNPGTLEPLSLPGKLLASLFQSITPRTAGFESLDYGHIRPSTLFFTILLMFIGASPGSTGGGIKTVTFFVLAGSAWSIARGRGELTVFGRRISLITAVKAGVIAMISAMLLGAAITALTITDPDQSFLRLAFEAASAFATAGLSTGITASLSVPGKVILILLMYLGRIGPLTFALALAERQPERVIRYPAGDVVVG